MVIAVAATHPAHNGWTSVTHATPGNSDNTGGRANQRLAVG